MCFSQGAPAVRWRVLPVAAERRARSRRATCSSTSTSWNTAPPSAYAGRARHRRVAAEAVEEHGPHARVARADGASRTSAHGASMNLGRRQPSARRWLSQPPGVEGALVDVPIALHSLQRRR